MLSYRGGKTGLSRKQKDELIDKREKAMRGYQNYKEVLPITF